MRAGKLRHRLTLLRPAGTVDARGDANPNHEPAGTAYGSIEPLSGRELWQAQQVKADVTHRITVRHKAGVGPRWRVQWNGRTFELGPPLSTEERGFDMIFTAVEVTWALPSKPR